MTMHPISDAPGQGDGIRAGDDVRIVTLDGRELRFNVVRASLGQICSARECVASESIARVDRQELDVFATVGVLALAFAIVVAITYAAAQASVMAAM